MPESVGADLLLEAVAKRPLWDLKPRSFDVLCRMCTSALDKPNGTAPGRLYFGGWVPLAMMLGFPAPPEGEPLPDTAKQAVRRAIRDLIDNGLIAVADDAEQAPHRYRAYRITL